MRLVVTAALLVLAINPALVTSVDVQSIVGTYGLTTATFNFSMPEEALNSDNANKWIESKWSLANSKVDWGSSNIVFSADPSTTSATLVRKNQEPRTKMKPTTEGNQAAATPTSVSSPAITDLNGQAPALRVGYPSGSYSKKTGGTQFYAQPIHASGSDNTSSMGNASSNGHLERMLLTYDIWFPSGFAFNKGGKLPGLRGGPDSHGCSGGNETDGTSCFSTRLMWRNGASGESKSIYAYIPTSQKGFCNQNQVTCNSDFGTSLARNSFAFATGQWQSIYLLVILNEKDTANGVVELWYNGIQALSFKNLVIRKSDSIESIGGLSFSTFFGGDGSDWATPTDQYVYFRNIALYGGLGASNLTGAAVKSAASRPATGPWSLSMGIILGLVSVFVGMWL
nr:alginate lyase [Cryptococcus depauperatus CBS 7855]